MLGCPLLKEGFARDIKIGALVEEKSRAGLQLLQLSKLVLTHSCKPVAATIGLVELDEVLLTTCQTVLCEVKPDDASTPDDIIRDKYVVIMENRVQPLHAQINKAAIDASCDLIWSNW